MLSRIKELVLERVGWGTIVMMGTYVVGFQKKDCCETVLRLRTYTKKLQAPQTCIDEWTARSTMLRIRNDSHQREQCASIKQGCRGPFALAASVLFRRVFIAASPVQLLLRSWLLPVSRKDQYSWTWGAAAAEVSTRPLFETSAPATPHVQEYQFLQAYIFSWALYMSSRIYVM